MEADILMDQIADALTASGYDVNTTKTYKNNKTTRALTVRLDDGANAAPAIYPEMLLEMAGPEMDIQKASDRVISFTREHMQRFPDMSIINDRDYILSHARLSVCNESWNAERLESTVHEHIEGTDLSVYPRIVGDEMSVTVTDAFLEHTGIFPEEIMEYARENSRREYTVRTMKSVMEEMYGNELPFPDENPMMVISNEGTLNGAAAIDEKKILDKARKELGSDSIYIIPSSTHELIAIPSENVSPEELESMIREVNGSCVNEQDRLSDHPYYYDGITLSMEQQRTKEQERPAGRSR